MASGLLMLFAALYTRLKGYRIYVLAFACVVWGCALWLGSTMRLDTGSTAFFPDSTPELHHMLTAMDMLPASRLLFINISTDQDNATPSLAAAADALVAQVPPELAQRVGSTGLPEPAHLLALFPLLADQATLDGLAEQIHSSTAESVYGGVQTQLSGLWGSVAFPWLRADPFQVRQHILQRLPQPSAVPVNNMTWGYPVSEDGKHLLLILRPTHSMRQVDKASSLMTSIDAIFAPYAAQGLQMRAVGGHRHAAANTTIIEHDIARIMIFSLLGFAGIYWALVRAKGALWLLLTPAFAASVALASMALYWPVVSGLAVGFGASVLGIAEDFAVHMHFALRSGNRAEKVIAFLSYPLLCAVLLSASGFAVLLLSGIPAVRQLAFFALCTLGAGFLIAFILIPLCPWSGQPLMPAKLTPMAAVPCAPRRAALWQLIAGVSVVACAIFYMFSAMPVDVSPRSMGADMAAIQADMAYMQSIWGKQQGTAFVVRGATVDEAMERARRVRVHLDSQRESVGGMTDTSGKADGADGIGVAGGAGKKDTRGIATISLVDLFPPQGLSEQRLQQWAAFRAAHSAKLRQVLQQQAPQYDFSAQTFDPFFQWFDNPAQSMDAQSLRNAGLEELVTAFLLEEEGQVYTLLTTSTPYTQELPPELASYTTQLSENTLETRLQQSFEHEKSLLPIMVGLWGLLLICCFRTLPAVLLAALPPLCTLLAVIGWLWLSGTALTLAAIAALPLVLGLASDHGVVMTHALGEETDTKVERATAVSSLTAITGMGLLAFSQHPVLQSMGLVIFLGLAVELPVSLWLLPWVYKHTYKDGV